MDYQSIIEELDDEKVKNLLEKMEIPYMDKGDYLICKTACHNADLEEASWKLYYYKNTKIFMCYTECGTMSIFKFLKNYYEARNIEYDWYNDIYQVIMDCSNFSFSDKFTTPKYESLKERYRPRKKIVELPSYPAGLIDVFIKYYPAEWLNDGITTNAMDKYNIRFSPVQNKIIIPHYDSNDRLIGIRGRALDEWEVENIGKYMPVQIENKWYTHPLSLNLYGLNKSKDNIKRTGICFIGEAEKFCLQADKFSRPNCTVAICGSHLSSYQIDLLMRTCQPKEIVLCLDKEEKPKEHKYEDELMEVCKRYTTYVNFSYIYDRHNLLKLKQSPTDCGEEVFEKLIERRTHINEI